MRKIIKQSIKYIIIGLIAWLLGLFLLSASIRQRMHPTEARDRGSRNAVPSPREVVAVPSSFGKTLDRTILVVYDISGAMGSGTQQELRSLTSFLEDVLFNADNVTALENGLRTEVNKFDSLSDLSLPLVSPRGKTNLIVTCAGMPVEDLRRLYQHPGDRERWLANFTEALFQCSTMPGTIIDKNNFQQIAPVIGRRLPRSASDFHRDFLSPMNVASTLALRQNYHKTFCTEYLLVELSATANASADQAVLPYIPFKDTFYEATQALGGDPIVSSTIYRGSHSRLNGTTCYCRISRLSPAVFEKAFSARGRIAEKTIWRMEGDQLRIPGQPLDLTTLAASGHVEVLDLFIDGWINQGATRSYSGRIAQDNRGLFFPAKNLPNPRVGSTLTIRSTAAVDFESNPPLTLSLPLILSREITTVVPAIAPNPLVLTAMLASGALLLILGGLFLYTGVVMWLGYKPTPFLEIVSEPGFTVYPDETSDNFVTYRLNVHLKEHESRDVLLGLRNVGDGVVTLKEVSLEGFAGNPYVTAREDHKFDGRPNQNGKVHLHISTTATPPLENPWKSEAFALVVTAATAPQVHRVKIRIIYHKAPFHRFDDWVGVDLGTYGCSAAISSLECDRDEESLLIKAPIRFDNNYEGYQDGDPDAGNPYVFPSVINARDYCLEDKGIAVGHTAKRLMGEQFDDYTFHAVKILIDRNVPFGKHNNKIHMIHVLQAQINPILDQIKGKMQCDQITRAVLTVPNVISYRRTQQLNDLAYDCEFEEMRLIEEACAMATTHRNFLPLLDPQPSKSGRILYVDMGGGTTDLALLGVKKSRSGISYPILDNATIYMGGEDIDHDIAAYLCHCLQQANSGHANLPKYIKQILDSKEDLIAPLPGIVTARGVVKEIAKEIYKHGFDETAFKDDGTARAEFNLPNAPDLKIQTSAVANREDMKIHLRREGGVIELITNRILAQIKNMNSAGKIDQILFTGRALNFNPLWDHLQSLLSKTYNIARLSDIEQRPAFSEIAKKRQITKLGVSIGAAKMGRLSEGGYRGKMLLSDTERKSSLTWGIVQHDPMDDRKSMFIPIIKKGDLLEGWHAKGEYLLEANATFTLGYVQKRIERHTLYKHLPSNCAWYLKKFTPIDPCLDSGRKKLLIRLTIDERTLRPTLKAYFTEGKWRQGLKSRFCWIMRAKAFAKQANIPDDQQLEKQTLKLEELQSWKTTWPN